MTVAKSVALRADVYTVVSAAVSGFSIPVYNRPPSDPPVEFIRMDGFEVQDAEFKVEEQGQHSFEIHHFDRPVGVSTTRDCIIRTETVLAAVHAALRADKIQGARVHHVYKTVDTDEDGITSHGVSRYTLLIR